MYLENIPSEAISSQILNGLQTYDILDNPRVGAEGLKYMQYIYLGRGKGNAYIFRGADRDSEGFLTLGSICSHLVNNLQLKQKASSQSITTLTFYFKGYSIDF